MSLSNQTAKTCGTVISIVRWNSIHEDLRLQYELSQQAAEASRALLVELQTLDRQRALPMETDVPAIRSEPRPNP